MSLSSIKINFILDTPDNNKITYSNKKRLCWFCQRECNNFVSICEYCKSERFSKNKKK